MSKLLQIFKLSRPRFWLYLAGPYAVGTAFTATTQTQFYSFDFLYPLFFFLVPANVFLYGVNDLFDKETDDLNKKKKTKETKISNQNRMLYRFAVVCSILFTLPLFVILNEKSQLLLIIFLILSYFYSAPPLRFKARPILDFSSNILYGMPAFIAYTQISNQWPDLVVWLVIFCWTGAMHLFSAIPDIGPDKKVGIKTTAVMLGKKKSLYLCSVLWGVTALVSSYINPFFLLAFIYPFIPIYILTMKSNITKVYWLFPYLNALLGFLLFWYYAIRFVL